MYVNTQNPPASTTIQTVFDDENILVEIDAIAIIPL
jgi:enamine deaminase RidA (YjgF/YER057c/UK114 family)